MQPAMCAQARPQAGMRRTPMTALFGDLHECWPRSPCDKGLDERLDAGVDPAMDLTVNMIMAPRPDDAAVGAGALQAKPPEMKGRSSSTKTTGQLWFLDGYGYIQRSGRQRRTNKWNAGNWPPSKLL